MTLLSYRCFEQLDPGMQAVSGYCTTPVLVI